ncbi:DinB family protein [Plantactinospora sp. GCM10030261]|uniref:DinB family protein n=1 Tax=Plantactinospora sp. GCM10030261 TaxID=3273420 RepID=UPI003618474A
MDEIEPVPFTPAGDETQTLLSTLDRIRATFAWKCGGLDAAGTAARLGPSTITLGGLLKHLALVEDHYFSHLLLGRPYGPPWNPEYDDTVPDWEWVSAADDTPEELLALWRAAVARSGAAVAEALADGGLDRLADLPAHGDTRLNLRRIMADMIEEYARHTGHADLIRESVDGLVGEDPARP